MKDNPLEAALNQIAQERPDLAKPETLQQIFPPLPNGVDLQIPDNYSLDPNKGIMLMSSKAVQPIYGFVIVPTALIKKDKDDRHPKVRLNFWDNDRKQWTKHEVLFDYATLTSTRKLPEINSSLQIVVSEQQRGGLAQYFADLWKANDRLQGLPVAIQKDRCGWSEDKKEFYPYRILNEESTAPNNGQTLLRSITESMKNIPQGNLEEAKRLVQELGDNPVFALCLAGCLASPVVPLIPGKLDENIGIDIAGKTTSGKTTIQKLAVDIIYGLGDLLKQSWAKLKDAGVWNTARVSNNLPLILDDTHRMKEQHGGIPHDLINGQEGPKSIQTEGGWEGIDPKRSQYKGTLFFNGEVPIYSTTPKDSAGIQGRIFMINRSPFQTQTTKDDVENYKKRGLDNAGHFAEPWIEHLIALGSDKIYHKIGELHKLFDCTGKDALYGRLATKAQVLVFCLQQFNELFDININVNNMIELLKESMEAQTDNVNVADNQMKLIVEKIFEAMAGMSYNEKDCILLNEGLSYNGLGKVNVCYVKQSHLIVKGSTLEQIIREGGYKSVKAVCEQLKNGGYLEASAPTLIRFPTAPPMEKNEARIQGYKFTYDTFEKFIPQEKN
ncbi:DUF927 domain-containing protein [Paenibacillus glufosinatiresistens]|uniref:DUF927 domain-containing protein n=1 Tax=Paenibacillus glufosinatiresistens TaxID=3070657 RepID=UPI00286E3FAD|nr:DUF927 domain-containing protein [Paenibacillus sp. YX.27]